MDASTLTQLDDLSLEKGVALGSPAHNFFDLPMPAALIVKPLLERNSRWMRELLLLTGVSIAPHGKTTMIPEIFRMQTEDGAWAITLSTLQQVRVARRFGIDRIFLANILADRREIRAIYAELARNPNFDFYCLIDSREALAALADCFVEDEWPRPVNVLVELGYMGGRTGCRSPAEALELARLASATRGVSLVGVEGFEGLIQKTSDTERDNAVSDFVSRLAELAGSIASERLFAIADFIVSAGGTGFIDLVVSGLQPVRTMYPQCRVLIRSGCYISFDSGQYEALFKRMAERGSTGFRDEHSLRGALEVWGRVISRPETGRIIVGAGKRDLGHDIDMPRPLKWLPSGSSAGPQPVAMKGKVAELNDQHAHIEIDPALDVRFGDLIGFGVSHPCTTFDKWKYVQVVEQDYRVLGTWKTYF